MECKKYEGEKYNKLEKESWIDKIKLSDYQKLNKSVKSWIDTNLEIPDHLWRRIRDVQSQLTIGELLKKIDKELIVVYGDKRDKAKSFADSRFTPLDKMIERGMISCGAMTNIFGTALRKLGIPVKFVHGILEKQEGEFRHSWLEIYNPYENNWFEVDPTKSNTNFKVPEKAHRIKIYHDWQELRGDYDKGEY